MPEGRPPWHSAAMTPTRALAAAISGATIAALALVSPAVAGPTQENTWVAPDVPVIKDYMEYSTVVMPSSGAATVFYGGKYRSYDPNSDSWSRWTTLASDTSAIRPVVNPRGDLCAQWLPRSGGTEITVACRQRGSAQWQRRTFAANREVVSSSIAVWDNGAMAMAVWLERRNTSVYRAKFSLYSAARGAWSDARTFPIASGDGRLASISVNSHTTGNSPGFVVHYTRDRAMTAPELVDYRGVTGTWLTTWTEGGGWQNLREVTLPLTGASPLPVTLMGLTSEDGKVAAIYGPALEPWWHEHDFWVSRLQSNAQESASAMGFSSRRPQIALSGGILGIAAEVPAQNSSHEMTLTIQRAGQFQTRTLTTPVLEGEQLKIWGMDITAQRMLDGAKGFSVSLELNRTYLDEASESYEDVQYLYAVTGYVDRSTTLLRSSAIERVGDGIAYDGMNPDIAGNGKKAIILYYQQSWAYAAFRRPS